MPRNSDAPSSDEKLLTVREVMELTGLKRQSIYRLITSQEFASTGKPPLISQSSVETYIHNRNLRRQRSSSVRSKSSRAAIKKKNLDNANRRARRMYELAKRLNERRKNDPEGFESYSRKCRVSIPFARMLAKKVERELEHHRGFDRSLWHDIFLLRLEIEHATHVERERKRISRTNPDHKAIPTLDSLLEKSRKGILEIFGTM